MRKQTIAKRALILYLVYHADIHSLAELSRLLGYASIGGFLAVHKSLFDDGLLKKEYKAQGTVTITKKGIAESRKWGILVYNNGKMEPFRLDKHFQPIL